MRDLDRGRRLERRDVQSARIDVREDVPDRAVLAAGVERLQDDQHRVAAARVELLLPFAERRAPPSSSFDVPVLVVLVAFVGRRRAVGDPNLPLNGTRQRWARALNIDGSLANQTVIGAALGVPAERPVHVLAHERRRMLAARAQTRRRSRRRSPRCRARPRRCAASLRSPRGAARCPRFAAAIRIRSTRTAARARRRRARGAARNPRPRSAARTCSTGRTAGNRRSRKSGCRSRRAARRGSRRAARS